MKLDPQDINYLVWRYLVENGFEHAAWSFYYEAGLNSLEMNSDKVPVNSLLNLLALGQRYAESQYFLRSPQPFTDAQETAVEPTDEAPLLPTPTPIIDIQLDVSKKFCFIRDRSASLLIFRVEDGELVDGFLSEPADGPDSNIAAATFFPSTQYIHAVTKAGLHFIIDPASKRILHRRFLFRKENKTTPSVMKFNSTGTLVVAGNSPFVSVVVMATRNSEVIDLSSDVPNLKCVTAVCFHPTGPQALAAGIADDNRPIFILMNLASKKFIEYKNHPITKLGYVHKLIIDEHNVYACHENGLDALHWPEAKVKPGSKNHVSLISNACVYDVAVTNIGDESIVGFVPSGGEHNGLFIQLSFYIKSDKNVKLDFPGKLVHTEPVESIRIIEGQNTPRPTFVTVSLDSSMAVIRGDDFSTKPLPAPSVSFVTVAGKVIAGMKDGCLFNYKLEK